MLKPITFWIVAILLMIVLSYFEYNLAQTADNSIDIFFALRIFSDAFAVLFLASILGSLVALIPFKKKKYINKFWLALPICACLMIILFIYSEREVVSYYSKNGTDKADGPSKNYKDVDVPPALNCSSVHNGKFETDNLVIEREGERQIQTNKKSKVSQEFKVTWISDCEYNLALIEDTTHILKVKITSVYPEGYDCYAATRLLARMYKMRKVADGK